MLHPHHCYFRCFVSTFSLLAATAFAGSLSAQTVPATVDPGRVSKPSEMPLTPLEKPSSAVETPSQNIVAAPAGADKILLTLKAIVLEGNNRFSESDLRPIYEADLGKEIPLSEIYRIAGEITNYYRSHGYVLTVTSIPPQELDENATVRLQIVEGFINNVKVQGQVPAALMKKIQNYADQLTLERPASIKMIERQLLLINDLPGISAKSTLTPANGATGGVDMVLDVSHQMYNARAGFDTYGNSYLGPERAQATGQINHVPIIVDSILISGLTSSNTNELKNAGVLLTNNIGSQGLKATASASRTATNPHLPGALGRALETRGRADQLSASLEYPLVRSRQWNWYVQSTFDMTDSRTDFAPGFEAIETRDHVRALRLSTQMNGEDPWAGYNTASLEFSRGIDVFGASEAGELSLSRALGEPVFTKFVGSLSRIQAIVNRVSLLVAAEGQWTSDPLLSPEEFGVGGYRFGRGFDSSEITGDRGAAGKIELAYGAAWSTPYLSDISYFTFYDVGRTWDIDPSVGVDSRRSLSSAGGGVRFNALERLQGEMYLAKPITNIISSRAADKQEDWRALINLSVEY